jgi:hypothetical protein
MKDIRWTGAWLLLLLSLSVWGVPADADAQVLAEKEHRIALHRADVIARIASDEMRKPERDEAADLLAGTPEQTYSYLVTPANVTITGGAPVYFDDVAIVRPGRRVFEARYYRIDQTTSGPIVMGNAMVSVTTTLVHYGNPVTVEIDLEPGKFYTFRTERPRGLVVLDIDDIGISAAETTDRRTIERAREKAQDIIANPQEYLSWVVTARDYDDYMAWWSSHRGALDGSYVSADGRTEIRFAGDRFEAYDRKALAGSTAFAWGSFLFDERTIVLQTDSIKTTTLAAVRGRPAREDVSIERIREILCYRLDGDRLEIPARTYELAFDFGGEFRRQAPAQGAAAAASPGSGSASATAGGMASLDIAWRVEDGTLTVSGRGDVSGDPSWSSVIDRFTRAVIGDGITSLGHHAFAMSKITSLVLGKDVAALKGYALFNCNDLETVEILNPVPPEVGAFAFMSTPVERARLIVPAGSRAAYERDRNWKKFGTIEER